MTAPTDHQRARSTDPVGRFPLVPRSKPPGRALHLRIDEVDQLARSGVEANHEDMRLINAAEALNKAALIASDCGIPDLARRLCWDQYDRFAQAAPLHAKTAKLALQPLVNLGRLAARQGEPDRAYEIFETLYHAVRSHHPAIIDHREVTPGFLAGSPETGRELQKFCWTILLADGTRALARNRRWHDALAHLKQRKGIGQRMLDGRQVAILAHTALGHTDQAHALLNTSRPQQSWEHAVLACLRTLHLATTRQPADTAADTMVQRYLQLPPQPGTALFTVSLGLTVTDIAADTQQETRLARRIISAALDTSDARIAADTLSSTTCRAVMTAAEIQHLTEVVHASGLDQGKLPACLRDQFLAATTSSSHQLTALLTRRNTHILHR